MRKAWYFVANRPIWGPFAAIDVAGALYLLLAFVAIFVFTCQSGCGGVIIERLPGTLTYKVDGNTHYPLCRDIVDVYSQEIDGMEGARIVKRAIEYWNEARGGVVFRYAGRRFVDLSRPFFGGFVVVAQLDGRVAKRLRDHHNPSPGFMVYGSTIQAHINAGLSVYSTYNGKVVSWDRTTARIKTGRCAIGGRVYYDYRYPETQYTAETAVIHELGHILGIGHSDEHYTIMRKRIYVRIHYHQTLGRDSIERLRELYPPFQTAAALKGGVL